MNNVFGIDAWQLWLFASVGLFILELLTPGFLLACFGIGALGAILPAAIGLGWGWQLGAFALCSILSLWLIRPHVLRLAGGGEGVPTGIDALVGRRIQVRTAIPRGAEYGEVAIDGDVWRARVEHGKGIEAGGSAEVIGYDGIILELRPTEAD